MRRVWNQDAFIHVRTDKIRDPLNAADPERFVCQSYKLVRIALNLVRYKFASLGDGDRYGPVRAWDVAPFRITSQTSHDQE